LDLAVTLVLSVSALATLPPKSMNQSGGPPEAKSTFASFFSDPEGQIKASVEERA